MRKWLLLSFVCLTVSSAVFHKQVLCFGARVFLHGVRLSYEEGNWEGATISLRKAKLEMKNGTSASFEQIDFSFPLKMKFYRPHVKVASSENTLNKRGGLYRLLTSRIFRKEFEVEDGVIEMNGITVPFSFVSDGKTGHAVIGDEHHGLFIAESKRKGKKCVLSASCENLLLPWILQAIGKECSSGKVNGQLAFELHKSSVRDVSYDVRIENGAFEREEIACEFDRVFMKREKESFQDHSLFKEVWPYLLCTAKLDKARVRIGSDEVQGSGILYFEEEKSPMFSVSGQWMKKGEEFPFQVNGDGRLQEGGRWLVECEAKTFYEGMAQQNAWVMVDNDGVEGELSCVRLDLISPLLKKVSFEGGDASGKFFLRDGEVVLEEMELVDVRGAVGASWAKGSYDSKEGSWNIDVRGGSWGKASDIDGHIQVRRKTIVGSKLKGIYDGIPGEIWAEGHFTNAHVHAVFKKFGKPFDVEAKVKQSSSGWKVQGEANVAGDIFDFGAVIAEKEVTSGWWKGKDVSADVINIPIKEMDYDWHVTGHFDLDGTFDGKRIDIVFDTRDGGFRSVYVDATLSKDDYLMPKERRKLCYDMNEGKWTGSIPIGKCTASVNQVDLPFENVSGKVNINGRHVGVESMIAYSYKNKFLGKVDLEFISGDVVDVEIQTDRIDGSASGMMHFLNHFTQFDAPLDGRVESGVDGMYLKTRVGEEGPLEWRFTADLSKGSYIPTEVISATEVSAHISWNSETGVFRCSNVDGKVDFSDATYRLNIPSVELDNFKACTFDARLEAKTHDIFRAAGTAQKNDEGIDIILKEGSTHLFGSKAELKECSLTPDFGVKRCNVEMAISCHDLIHQIALLTDLGLMDVHDATIDDLRSLDLEGMIDMEIDIFAGAETWTFRAKSETITIDDRPVSKFDVDIEKEGPSITINQLCFGNLSLIASIEKNPIGLTFPLIEGKYKNSFFKLLKGRYDYDTEVFAMHLRAMELDLEQMAPFFEKDLSFLSGLVTCEGDMKADLTRGIKRACVEADFSLSSSSFGRSEVAIETTCPFHLSYSLGEKGLLKGGGVRFVKDELWASCDVGTIAFAPTFSGSDIQVVVPPEMLLYLVDKEKLPFSVPFEWENQIDAKLSFDSNSFHCALKDGYYWFGEKSWRLDDVALSYTNEKLHTAAKVAFKNHCFVLEGDGTLSSGQLTIREEGQEEAPLVISGDYNDHVVLSHIEGHLCGLEFTFDANTISSTSDEAVLTGHVRMDVPKLSTYISEEMAKRVEELGIGNGYTLRGDLISPRASMHNSYFKGFLKAKHFELMGSTLQTLMSEITLSRTHLHISDLTLSDDAGILTLEQMECTKQNDGHWLMTIPTLTLTDFRPSLLNKIGRYRGRMKPMIIRNLTFTQIEGIIGERNSFIGVGHLTFENSFKKETNFLAIPMEIIARLGLDTALLMPIKGRLDYNITQGRIYLTSLTESYSDGKRSHFYLSPSRPSFIDFDGDLNINIKMKQYVLLKVTEPFTLSIRGNVEKPKFALN